MFETMTNTKKTLIIVYKDELIVNQIRKSVDTHDDTEVNVIGTKDDSIEIVSWTEKVWKAQKKAGDMKGKILFIGDIKGVKDLLPIIDVKFNEYGVKFGWAGKQAVIYANLNELRDSKTYFEFMQKLLELPVPDFLKKTAKRVGIVKGEKEMMKWVPAGDILSRCAEWFMDKKVVERQMLFYGVVKMYYEGLEEFMNQ